jgi:hypothetical protein
MLFFLNMLGTKISFYTIISFNSITGGMRLMVAHFNTSLSETEICQVNPAHSGWLSCDHSFLFAVTSLLPSTMLMDITAAKGDRVLPAKSCT